MVLKPFWPCAIIQSSPETIPTTIPTTLPTTIPVRLPIRQKQPKIMYVKGEDET